MLSFMRVASAPGLMRFVEHDRAEPPLQEETPFVGVVDDQAGRDNGDAKWTTRDVFRAACFYDVSVLVHPYLLGRQPHGARDAELVFQFHLPLQRQRGGAEDQDRPI